MSKYDPITKLIKKKKKIHPSDLYSLFYPEHRHYFVTNHSPVTILSYRSRCHFCLLTSSLCTIVSIPSPNNLCLFYLIRGRRDGSTFFSQRGPRTKLPQIYILELFNHRGNTGDHGFYQNISIPKNNARTQLLVPEQVNRLRPPPIVLKLLCNNTAYNMDP